MPDNNDSNKNHGSDLAQVVSRRPLTAEATWFLWWTEWPWTSLSLSSATGQPLKRLIDDVNAETETGHPGLTS
jgi:hypothetical protein